MLRQRESTGSVEDISRAHGWHAASPCSGFEGFFAFFVFFAEEGEYRNTTLFAEEGEVQCKKC